MFNSKQELKEYIRGKVHSIMLEAKVVPVINMTLSPLQRYIYDYEVEISGENFANKELKNIRNLNNIKDVKKYYWKYRGWEDRGWANKDLEDELNSLIKTLKAKKYK